ncbi:MAG: polyphosphate kinase 1 [Lactobacillaceae bacterium]|jgi:polyphosphate kinase|nr:polyphosphate kinase 1 [Lactobacillaceae bacterium]
MNRELSWLSFNDRIIKLVKDPSQPLLERANFLSITQNNLDEWYEVRVASLIHDIQSGSNEEDPSGLTAAEQLKVVRKAVKSQLKEQYKVYTKSLLPDLNKYDINIVNYVDLNNKQLIDIKKQVIKIYKQGLIDISIIKKDEGWPKLASKTINIIATTSIDNTFGNIQISENAPQLLRVTSSNLFVRTVDAIRENAQLLFKKLEVVEKAFEYRIIRDAYMPDLPVNSSDVIADEKNLLASRSFAEIIHLSINKNTPNFLKNKLSELLYVNPNNIFKVQGPLDFSFVSELKVSLLKNKKIDVSSLQYVPREPHHFKELENKNIFDNIEKHDYLLHHPYDSFDPVVNFFQAAANDKKVSEIWLSLYRASKKSPIIDALKLAAKKGKKVNALIEIKARFDEENNLKIVNELRSAGVNVSTSFADYKVHSKMAMVVRNEKKYVHLSTGNYNEKSAHFYTDFGIFTSNIDITNDISNIFNYVITQKNQPKTLKQIQMAPTMIRPRLTKEIKRLTDLAQAGSTPEIWIKVNSLSDKKLIDELYIASNSGVHIHLLVRGIATAKVDSNRLGKNIQIHSIVGRLLEHSRIYLFKEDNQHFNVYISSADVMPRNYDRRVELLIPVLNKDNKQKLYDLFNKMWHDRAQTFAKKKSGKYIKRSVKDPKVLPIQEALLIEAEQKQGGE